MATFASHTAPMRSLFSKLFKLGTWCLIVLLALGFLGALHPAFDTLSHARAHLAVVLGMVAIVYSLFSCNSRRLGLACYLVAFASFASAAVGYPVSAQIQTPVKDLPVYKLLHFNILWSNQNKDRLIDWVQQVDPDFISITEASYRWKQKLKTLDKRWPYKLDCDDREIRGGLIIYSRLPFQSGSEYCSKKMVYGSATIDLDNGVSLDLASVHFRWPWPRAGARQVKLITPTLEKFTPATILAGDFNATPWSHQVKGLADAGKLQIVPGIGPSWLFRRVPEGLSALVGLPIDHALTGKQIRVLEAKRGPQLGSDHFPYVMTFQITK